MNGLILKRIPLICCGLYNLYLNPKAMGDLDGSLHHHKHIIQGSIFSKNRFDHSSIYSNLSKRLKRVEFSERIKCRFPDFVTP